MSFHIMKVRSTLREDTDPEMVKAYLPANFRVLGLMDDEVVVIGHDHLGWTAEQYVIPRLQSGMFVVAEVDITEERA